MLSGCALVAMCKLLEMLGMLSEGSYAPPSCPAPLMSKAQEAWVGEGEISSFVKRNRMRLRVKFEVSSEHIAIAGWGLPAAGSTCMQDGKGMYKTDNLSRLPRRELGRQQLRPPLQNLHRALVPRGRGLPAVESHTMSSSLGEASRARRFCMSSQPSRVRVLLTNGLGQKGQPRVKPVTQLCRCRVMAGLSVNALDAHGCTVSSSEEVDRGRACVVQGGRKGVYGRRLQAVECMDVFIRVSVLLRGVREDLRRLGLVERRSAFGVVQSNPRNNSQTIHCGDIETNYTLRELFLASSERGTCLRGTDNVEKARVVKRQADMLRNFATKLPPSVRDKVVFRFPKMALAVGPEECDFMEKRFKIFRELFTSLQLINKQQICEVEPRVGLRSSNFERPEEVCAMYVPNEYTGVDYVHLAEAFVEQAKALGSDKASARAEPLMHLKYIHKIDLGLNTEVLEIRREREDLFSIRTNRGVKQARFVVVSACGHSLLFAQRMGYGLQYSCLPMAGSFYFTERMLNGKVYTVQDSRLPFAAVHGDPDVVAQGLTRFGPTALPLPLLERFNICTLPDFLRVVNPDLNLLKVYIELLNTRHMRNYVLRNFLFEVPVLNHHLFAKDVSKIVPSIKPEDLKYAKGFGGVRPQLIDKEQKKLLLGEGKIMTGENIIFNITPSPGGTTCLGTAQTDLKEIVKQLGAEFNEKAFNKTLLDGEYPVVY
ncbi:FAD malate-dehydrogenase [Cyclospora cayetanensis]|uniref:FAD malate-dehydrogenase n=1 Tax=Cyclospora cayetanensis TaxID=88456 RepID=A0A1D3CWK5_9EIME|nr:FAD malate-dehydrogenase [Cyclospora cayetanensis]